MTDQAAAPSEPLEPAESAGPPTTRGPLARREARLAWGLLLPTLTIIAAVVVLPLIAIFWISFKPVSLADLRPPEVLAREDLRGDPLEDAEVVLRYRLRNTSQDKPVEGVRLTDTLPGWVTEVRDLDPRCALDGAALACDLGDWEPGQREQLLITVVPGSDIATVEDARGRTQLADDPEATEPGMTGTAENILTNFEFTTENYRDLFAGSDLVEVTWSFSSLGAFVASISSLFDKYEFINTLAITLFYTVFGTLGAITLGLFAAMLLNKEFRGQGILRGLYLFPYVAPIIAVAYTWLVLLDPSSGSVNALLFQMGLIDEPLAFFGQRPLALISVTVFAMWGYFPLSFLFILARMQSIDSSMYEAAEMDGASPFQKFWYLSLPQLMGILSVLFLLRFIWTFNKFDDIFLLTGGASGTRTLTVSVYDQAFAAANIGAGAAVAVVVFLCLLLFSVFFFKYLSREEGL